MLWCAPIGSCRAVKHAWHSTDTSWLPSPANGHVGYFAKPLESKIVRPTSKHADVSPSPVWPQEPKLNNKGFPFSVSGFEFCCVSVRHYFRRYKTTQCATTSNDGPWERYERAGLLGGNTHTQRRYEVFFKSLLGRGSAG